MRGTYDPDNELDFELVGAHLSMSLARVFLRAEYLVPAEPLAKTELAAQEYRQLVTTSRLPGSAP